MCFRFRPDTRNGIGLGMQGCPLGRGEQGYPILLSPLETEAENEEKPHELVCCRAGNETMGLDLGEWRKR